MTVATGRACTYAEDDDENHEGVHHREEGRRDGGEHLGELLHTTKEPHDAEGPQQPDQPVWEIEGPVVDEGQGDESEIQQVPPALEIHLRRDGCNFDHELQGEDSCEEIVDLGDKFAELWLALVFVLRIQNAHHKVLQVSHPSEVDRTRKQKSDNSSYCYNEKSHCILENSRICHGM
jgi:hypothetical protein